MFRTALLATVATLASFAATGGGTITLPSGAINRPNGSSAGRRALSRAIEGGTYGYCEETGEPISLKRLEARPIATLSVEAQERHERRERVYRDE